MGIAERKDLWFSSVNYNLVRVLNRLAEIVEGDGGTVLYKNEERLIHTRGFSEPIARLYQRKGRIETTFEMMPNSQHSAARIKAISSLNKELQDLMEEEEKAPVVKSRFVSAYGLGMWIDFEIGGFQYHFSPDDNPFFPDGVSKIPVGAKGRYYRDVIESGNKPWLIDDLFKPVATDESIESAARTLYGVILDRPISERFE